MGSQGPQRTVTLEEEEKRKKKEEDTNKKTMMPSLTHSLLKYSGLS
jgi:hypothetical protein